MSEIEKKVNQPVSTIEQAMSLAEDTEMGLDQDVSETLTIKIAGYPGFKYNIPREAFRMCEQGKILTDTNPTYSEFEFSQLSFTNCPYKQAPYEEVWTTPEAVSNVLDYLVRWYQDPIGHQKASEHFMTPEHDAKGDLVVDETKFLRVDRDKKIADFFKDEYEKKVFGRLFTRPRELAKTIYATEHMGVPELLEKVVFVYACYIERLDHSDGGIIPDAVRHYDPVVKEAKERFEKEHAHEYTVPAEKVKARNEYAEKVAAESIQKYLDDYGYQAMSDLMYKQDTE
jgi:hypothetical protein